MLGNNAATLNAMGNAMAIATSGPVNTLAGGSHTIKAVYNPSADPNYSGNNNTVGYTVQPVDVQGVTVASSGTSTLGAR